jgi:hypothetical protein
MRTSSASGSRRTSNDSVPWIYIPVLDPDLYRDPSVGSGFYGRYATLVGRSVDVTGTR